MLKEPEQEPESPHANPLDLRNLTGQETPEQLTEALVRYVMRRTDNFLRVEMRTSFVNLSPLETELPQNLRRALEQGMPFSPYLEQLNAYLEEFENAARLIVTLPPVVESWNQELIRAFFRTSKALYHAGVASTAFCKRHHVAFPNLRPVLDALINPIHRALALSGFLPGEVFEIHFGRQEKGLIDPRKSREANGREQEWLKKVTPEDFFYLHQLGQALGEEYAPTISRLLHYAEFGRFGKESHEEWRKRDSIVMKMAINMSKKKEDFPAALRRAAAAFSLSSSFYAALLQSPHFLLAWMEDNMRTHYRPEQNLEQNFLAHSRSTDALRFLVPLDWVYELRGEFDEAALKDLAWG